MDSGSELKAVQALAPASQSVATHNGDAVDTKGFKEALFILNAGVASATGTADVKVQECATSDGQYADIEGAAFTQITTANDVAIYQGRVRITPTRKRYLRAVAVVGTDVVVLGVAVILGDAQNLPAAEPAFDIHG